jgi:hypothetical protein
MQLGSSGKLRTTYRAAPVTAVGCQYFWFLPTQAVLELLALEDGSMCLADVVYTGKPVLLDKFDCR